jgi:hypothetical protein
MKRQIPTIVFGLALAVGSVSAQQAQAPAPPAEQPAATPAAEFASGGSTFIGTRALDETGWPGRINQYELNQEGFAPALSTNFWFSKNSWFIDAFAENRGGSRASSYWLDADLNRRVRIRTSVERFLNRQVIDPLTNLDTARGNVVVRFDDFAPNRALVPGRNEMNTKIDGYITEWLTWRASHRSIQYHGEIQTRSISKCANCHVNGEATRVNQKSHDLSAGMTMRLSRRAAVHYDYTSRQFREHGQTPTTQYDVAQHPASLSRVFFNRVLYDATTLNGEVPYALVPGFRKSTHDLKLNVDLPAESRLTAQLLQTNARNSNTRLNLNVLAWGGRYVLPLTSRLTFKAQFRKADMHSDDVYVEFDEVANPAGVPQAGLTYVQAYPAFGSVDFTRGSTINRRDIVGNAELGLRLAKLTTIRTGYQYRSIRRENFEVDRTDRNRFFFLFNARKSKTWNARVRYTLDAIDDPFLHKHAALSPMLQPNPSAGDPPSPLPGTQYFTMYQARQANLSNQPTSAHAFEPSFSWTPSARASLTLHYRTRIEKNDQLNFGDWTRDMHMPGAELWVAPVDKLNFTLAYSYQTDKSNTLFVIPAFDG